MREIKFRAWDFLNKHWFEAAKIVLENGVIDAVNVLKDDHSS